MSLNNTDKSFGSPAKGLHWISALIVLGMLPLGFFMVSLDASPFKFDLYWWHKSFGTLLFLTVLARLLLRFTHAQPAPLEHHARWEKVLAKIIHVLLYVGMVGMPLSGLLMSMAADFPAPFFGLHVPDLVPGKHEGLFRLMRTAHEWTAWALLAAVALHGAGAFKHHIIDRDITLLRMLPDIAPRAGAAVALSAFVVLLGAATLFGFTGEDDDEQQRPAAMAVQATVSTPVAAVEVDHVASAAPHWAIIPDDSRIGFRVKVEGQEFEGRFDDFSGDIYFDPEDPAQSRVSMRVNIASVQTGSDERDQYIVMPPWLNAESFPESTLQTSSIEKIAENQYVAHTNLTLRGVSKAVEVPFTLDITRDSEGAEEASMQGQFEINRLDFGIGTGEWSNPDTVANTLSISVSLKARQE